MININFYHAPIIAGIGVALIFTALISQAILRGRKEKREYRILAEQFEIYSQNLGETKEKKKSYKTRFYDYWDDLLRRSKVTENKSRESNVHLVMLCVLIPSTFFSLLTLNLFVGVLMGIVALFALNIFCHNRLDKQNKILDSQVPPFLNAFKSNINNGNIGIENAFRNAVDTTSEPLRSELITARSLMDTAGLSYALAYLSRKTASPQMRFFCNCMDLASKAGTNAKTRYQVEEIEDIMREKRASIRTLEKEVNANKPLSLTSLFLPAGIFFFLYLTDEMAQAYWFVEPASWLWLIFIIATSLGGFVISNRIIRGLEKEL